MSKGHSEDVLKCSRTYSRRPWWKHADLLQTCKHQLSQVDLAVIYVSKTNYKQSFWGGHDEKWV